MIFAPKSFTSAPTKVTIIPDVSYKLFGLLAVFALIALAAAIDFALAFDDQWSLSALPLSILIFSGLPALCIGLRLRNGERRHPEYAGQPSRRWAGQLLVIVATLAVVIHAAVLLFMVLSGHFTSGNASDYQDYSSTLDGGFFNMDYDSQTGNNNPNLWLDIGRFGVTLVLSGLVWWAYCRDVRKHAR